jgi:UDP-N-acetylmuramyl tripeptide synthase
VTERAGRSAVAAPLGLAVAAASRRLGRGSGSVIGGRVTLALDPGALRRLAAGHALGLVSGTNGKTTTTRLLASALATAGPVVSNQTGSNLPPGLVAALARAPAAAAGALEVDEAWLGRVLGEVNPVAVGLLNLSRDQLDRVSEVRLLGARWRAALAAQPGVQVVANCDDPIVAWAASAASQVTWVAAGQAWRLDASGCPACEARVYFEGEEWKCPSCGLTRPRPEAWLEEESLLLAGRVFGFRLALPGRFNRANAAVAAVMAGAMGVEPDRALQAMAGVGDVEGRYQVLTLPGGPGPVRARLLLAKNPAGWTELLDLVTPPPVPVVLAINARLADGRDPSWLWDVPFERLAGRPAVVSGERRRDLAVRLRYAGVHHEVVEDLVEAVRVAGAGGGGPARGDTREVGGTVDVIANYTAFQDLRAALLAQGAR